MMASNFTRFRAYMLGTSGSLFTYFANGHFTVIEGRLTDVCLQSLRLEMDICGVTSADTLHVTSWDADHCRASELPRLLREVRPLRLELPGYEPSSENGRECFAIFRDYVEDRRSDNRSKSYIKITPLYIGGLRFAQQMAFSNTFYNPLFIDPHCANDNSTVKHFREGSFNVLSLGDVECFNISARLARCRILKRETDVMILAHHGADNGFTTKKFIRNLEPKLALCSSDYANQYDHPRSGVRDLLYEEGVRLMTTKTGDVVVMSTGDHVGEYKAINLCAGSTAISSEASFISKKSKLLTNNGDTVRQIYSSTPRWQTLRR